MRPANRLLTTAEAAAFLGVSRSTLAIARMKGGRLAIPYILLSPKCVRYDLEVVQRWLAERTYRSTAEYSEPSPMQRNAALARGGA
jgi:predicted DNA-binding transcriptional regulator AlpA